MRYFFMFTNLRLQIYCFFLTYARKKSIKNAFSLENVCVFQIFVVPLQSQRVIYIYHDEKI